MSLRSGAMRQNCFLLIFYLLIKAASLSNFNRLRHSGSSYHRPTSYSRPARQFINSPVVQQPQQPLLLDSFVLSTPPRSAPHLISSVFKNPLAKNEDNNFEDSSDPITFTHLQIDNRTGDVYAASVNRLYRLTDDLRLLQFAKTGPAQYNPKCSPTTHQTCDNNAPLTNNFNKVLIVNERENQLISCGSIFGQCVVRDLKNISAQIVKVNDIVANDNSSSTVAFIAPGPRDSEPALYVGSTYTDLNQYSSAPAVSTRSLDVRDELDYVYSGFLQDTYLKTNAQHKKSYLIDYIYGFSIGNFSYFLTIQPRSVEEGSNGPYVSKLVRLCHADSKYYSYTEVALECRNLSNPNINYNLAQAAYLGSAGSDLAGELGITTNDSVLFVAFAESSGRHQPRRPNSMSAVCVYSRAFIQAEFTRNIKECYSGGMGSLGFVQTRRNCSKTALPITEDFCGTDVNHPVNGSTPIVANAVMSYNDVRLTSIASSSVNDHTVLFMGSERGTLKKAIIHSDINATQYDDIIIESGSPILPDMRFSPSREHLYIQTAEKIYKIKVHDCSTHSTCQECRNAKDPYCGWCSFENKCSLRNECYNNFWIALKSGQCTSIRSVEPRAIQIDKQKNLLLNVDNLPHDGRNMVREDARLKCVFKFGDLRIESAAWMVEGDRMTCDSPSVGALPAIAHGEHSIEGVLSIVMKHVREEDSPEFASTSFTFFDCGRFENCSSCVSSDFDCDWCVRNHMCTNNAIDQCMSDSLVNGIAKARSGDGLKGSFGDRHCPSIGATRNFIDNAIVVASGTNKQVSVNVANLHDFQTQLRCRFEFEDGEVQEVGATLLPNAQQVRCAQFFFFFDQARRNSSVKLSILWHDSSRVHGFEQNSDKALDNPSDLHVFVYKCEQMANNCGSCLNLAPQYQCGWCDLSRCQVESQCSSNPMKLISPQDKMLSSAVGGPRNENWLRFGEVCPNPQITKIYPSKGPVEGGTHLTIEGINLGRSYDDIRVMVANNECIAFKAKYEVSSRIVCQTAPLSEPLARSETRPVEVTVTIANEYTAAANEYFHYVVPHVKAISTHGERNGFAASGPKDGGTNVTIIGENLDAGSHISAIIGGNKLCNVTMASDKRAVCVTSASESLGEKSFEMSFDGMHIPIRQKFAYTRNPEVNNVRSILESGRREYDEARGLLSGGSRVLVSGKNFATISEPKMVVYYKNRAYLGKCMMLAEDENPGIQQDHMQCYTPSLVDSGVEAEMNEGRSIEMKFGFLMDNVRGVKELSRTFDFKLYPDPEILPFAEANGVKHLRARELSVRGNMLNYAAGEDDIRVSVGNEICNLTSLSVDEILCIPPMFESGKELVQVQIGMWKAEPGYVSFEPQTAFAASFGSIHLPIIAAAIGVVIIIMIIVITVFGIAYRRKSAQSSRALKSMQDNIDGLELQVAAECKEAFAELQTDITDWHGDLFTAGLPIRDYKSFVLNVLFPNPESHPFMNGDFASEIGMSNPNAGLSNGDALNKQSTDSALKLFQQLLLNKNFLLLFIRTLESNRYFSLRDRVNVASLIMISLQSDMVYCTDILKTLLSELIERCVENRQNVKLLLRRNESVSEKMLSAWCAMLLWKYLRETAGEQLYVLFRAIQLQIDKGAVDAITCEAKYSLSEEKLIRSRMDTKKLTLFISCVYNNQTTQETAVKVLDCDTISQVKEKALDVIFRNCPFSVRPKPENLDLEWRQAKTSSMLLQDEDKTSQEETVSGCTRLRRLNTLAHYHVPDSSVFVLVPRLTSIYNLTMMSDRSDRSLFSTKSVNSPQISRGHSPFYAEADHGGVKHYHLVKPSEHNDAPPSRDGTTKRSSKMVSEIYLTRLLTTKKTLKKFIDDLFETIFASPHNNAAFPMAIKYLFDFLDEQAIIHDITDPEVVHIWKSNSLPMRFWVNLIKNPNFIFDVYKSNTVDACLSVIASALMDSCSTTELKLTKESPSSKLLFAKDIKHYKGMVQKFYEDIHYECSPVSDQDFNAVLAEESRGHRNEFNTRPALQELYNYCYNHKEALMQTLEEDEVAQKNRLAHRLYQVHHLMRNERL